MRQIKLLPANMSSGSVLIWQASSDWKRKSGSTVTVSVCSEKSNRSPVNAKGSSSRWGLETGTDLFTTTVLGLDTNPPVLGTSTGLPWMSNGFLCTNTCGLPAAVGSVLDSVLLSTKTGRPTVASLLFGTNTGRPNDINSGFLGTSTGLPGEKSGRLGSKTGRPRACPGLVVVARSKEISGGLLTNGCNCSIGCNRSIGLVGGELGPDSFLRFARAFLFGLASTFSSRRTAMAHSMKLTTFTFLGNQLLWALFDSAKKALDSLTCILRGAQLCNKNKGS